MSPTAADLEARPGWSAELELHFAWRAGRTILARRAHRGPLVVQRPFHPEGPDLVHVYLLHPPGGLVSGDTLTTDVRVEAGAHALLTTPAAAKVYRSRSGSACSRQTQRLLAGPGSTLEWLPQETIVFDGAQVALETIAQLQGDAAFIGWEICCFGRPALAERYSQGTCRQRFEVWRDGRPLCLDRLGLQAGSPLSDAAWGLAGRPVTGTFLASPPPTGTLEPLRAACAELPAGDQAAVTELDGVLLARYLGASTERCRALFSRLWTIVRPALLGRPASFPRIWST
jgi:urease accessory protein